MKAIGRLIVISVTFTPALVAADRTPRISTDLIDRFDSNAKPQAEQAGVGIALVRRDGRLFVGRVLPGTPAALSGSVHAGDRLLAVGQESQKPVPVEGLPIEKAVPLIRGTKGTLVILTLIPAGKSAANAIDVPLVRGAIKELNIFGDGHRIAPGARAPEFEAVVLPGGGKFELGNCTGKIVVLEFWSSGCAPCLKLLDHVQDLRRRHAEWKDRVEFVAVGIDEDRSTASRCFESRGKQWTGLQVVWAGTAVLKPFHIAGLPGAYLLDQQGKVIAHDPKADLAATINRALVDGSNDQPPK